MDTDNHREYNHDNRRHSEKKSTKIITQSHKYLTPDPRYFKNHSTLIEYYDVPRFRSLSLTLSHRHLFDTLSPSLVGMEVCGEGTFYCHKINVFVIFIVTFFFIWSSGNGRKCGKIVLWLLWTWSENILFVVILFICSLFVYKKSGGGIFSVLKEQAFAFY